MKPQAFFPIVTYPDAVSEATAAAAVDFAARLGADLHVTVYHGEIPKLASPLGGLLLDLPQMIRDTETACRERGERLLARVREESAGKGVALSSGTGSAPLALIGEAAAADARYFDIVLLGWEVGNPTARATAEAVLFGAGRPVVLVPASGPAGPVASRHVAIAWDGSRVAARAVADARPLLEAAARISVLTVVDEKPLPGEDIGRRLADALSGRGLTAEAVSINAEDCPIGVSLQEHAASLGADLLVMGGYGHSRVRDFVLGGATEDVLSELKLPVLLAH